MKENVGKWREYEGNMNTTCKEKEMERKGHEDLWFQTIDT